MNLPIRALLGDSVMLRIPKQETETSFGIVIPTANQEYPDTGEVVLLPTVRHPKLPFPGDHLKIGDKVLFDRHAGDKVFTKDKLGNPDVEFRIVLLDSIYARIEEKSTGK